MDTTVGRTDGWNGTCDRRLWPMAQRYDNTAFIVLVDSGTVASSLLSESNCLAVSRKRVEQSKNDKDSRSMVTLVRNGGMGIVLMRK